jgi:hypothetical protein
MVLGVLPPPGVGALHAPPLANVFLPKSKQLVPVKAAAPEVVIALHVVQLPELAEPRDRVIGVSTLVANRATSEVEVPPLTVRAPLTVVVPDGKIM